MVAHGDAGHPLADRFDNPAAFMAKNNGEQALGIFTGEGESVGVADPRGDDLDAHFARFGR